MEKSKSSKKDRLEKLRISLESDSGGKLHPEDEKYLKVLQNRLSRDSKESTVNINRESGKTDTKDDPLKPQVIIHHKEEKIEEPKFIPPEVEKVEIKEESEIKDKELFEIKKVEVTGPEFLEIKPKEPIKKAEISEKKITQKIEETEHKEYEKLPEWEPVETKKVEQEQIEEKVEVEEKPELKEEEISEFESVEYDVEEVKSVKEEVPEEKSEPEFEVSEEEKKPELEEDMFFEEKGETLFGEGKQNKLDVFKELTSIDEKTSNLLYNNGFTSIDDLKIASVKDLSRIKGIKRKLAKKIKKELEELEIFKENKDITPKEESSESFILEEEFEETKKEEEFVPEEEFMEDEKMFFDEDEEQTLPTKKDERIEVFNGIESIDEKTASLLVKNGIISIDILKETSVKELAKINGINKKLAKKIKKEIKKKSKKAKKTTYSIAEGYDKDISKDFEEPSEQIAEEKEPSTETKERKKKKPKKKSKQYKHGSYTLYKKDVKTKSKKSKKKSKKEVYFFSKQKRNKAEPSDLPKGFEVKINRKTGVPYLRKKK